MSQDLWREPASPLSELTRLGRRYQWQQHANPLAVNKWDEAGR